MQKEKENIVEIRGAYKRYSSNHVILRGLNMTVEKGSIYGLLGPSGCGKTTLLTCLTGYRGIDNGSMTVHLDNRTQLGYMPQEIALMELFSVSEMLQYFGKVNGMETKEIEDRGKILLHLMELDPIKFWKRTIGSLSGGQQRRISLTVALLHNPVLLILDEPTVGLDPLLSQKLWEFFLDITQQQKKTLILTTHYIEEARRADMIGLMRNGVLLEEKPPQHLLAEYSCETLEDVFLLLSQKQNIICIENEEIYTINKNIKPPIQRGAIYEINRVKAQIYKNVCWAKRNIPVMTFILLLPALLMFLFGIVYSDTLNGIVIAAVTEEVLPDSCLRPSNPDVVLPRCKPESQISCHFLKLMQDKSYIVKEFQDYDSAYNSLEHGHAAALLYFNKNFSWSVIRRLSNSLITPDRYVNSSMIDVNLDMAEVMIGSKVRKDIIDSFDDMSLFIFSDCQWNIRGSESVLKFQSPVFGESSPKFSHSALGGFVIVFTFYITTFFSASSIISEKMSGFLERCLVSGVRQTEVMIAHLVIQMIMLVGQNSMLLTIAYGVYRFPMNGSFTLTVVFILLAEIQGMFYGFFLGTFLDVERNISYASIGTVVCLFLTCGMFWPIEGAHWIIYPLLRNNPLVMAVESYRSITIRGWDLSNYYIAESMIVNIIFAVLCLLSYVLACKIKK